MTFSQAISKKELKGLKEVVARATKIYNAECGEEPYVNTVYGDLPFSAVLDEETKWQLCAVAYADVLRESKYIEEGLDKRVEVAKLIATNPTLRAMVSDTTSAIDTLI
jgi:hypothetical protein